MERLQSPTTELTRELGALRLDLMARGHQEEAEEDGTIVPAAIPSHYDHTLLPHTHTHTHTHTNGSIIDDHLIEKESLVSSSSSPQTVSVVSPNSASKSMPLVFSHLEPTHAEAVGVSCGCVPIPAQASGMELNQHQTCPSCGHTHPPSLAPPTSCTSTTSREAEMLSCGLQSLSVSHPYHHHHHHQTIHEVQPHPSSSAVSAGSNNSPSSSFTTTHSVTHHHNDNPAQWEGLRNHGNLLPRQLLCQSCRTQALRLDYNYPSDVTVDDLAGYFDQLLHLPRPMSEMAELMYT